MDGLMTSLKSTLGEAGAGMAQEGVGYGAERAGGAEPSTVPELLNRIGTAGVMALGMGGAMGVPAGASHVQSINRFAEGQARIPQIQQRLGQLQQMREELLRPVIPTTPSAIPSTICCPLPCNHRKRYFTACARWILMENSRSAR